MNNIDFLNTMPHNIVKYISNDKYYVMIGPFDGYSNINKVTYIYVDINDKLCDPEDTRLYDFIKNIAETGLTPELINSKDFILGIDWKLSKSYAELLINQIDEEQNVTIAKLKQPDNIMYDYYKINTYELNRSSFYDISSTKLPLHIFNKANKISDYKFEPEQLNNFYATFCSIILYMADYDLSDDMNVGLQHAVLSYYANSKVDEGIKKINMILSTPVNTAYKNTCNCIIDERPVFNLNNSGSIPTESCASLYEKSMATHLYKMLGDIEFYKYWFFTDVRLDEPWNENADYISVVNEEMVDLLILFIQSFIELDYNLIFNKGNSHDNCGCNLGSDENKCNYEILNNYLKALNYIKNDELEGNTNKIKVYGEAFGKLLPNLVF